jgi:hypothetical protein
MLGTLENIDNNNYIMSLQIIQGPHPLSEGKNNNAA